MFVLILQADHVFVLILQIEHVFASYPSDNYPSWWVVFSPLFVSDALNAYFCVIVFIRMYIDVSTVKIWTTNYSNSNRVPPKEAVVYSIGRAYTFRFGQGGSTWENARRICERCGWLREVGAGWMLSSPLHNIYFNVSMKIIEENILKCKYCWNIQWWNLCNDNSADPFCYMQ